MFNKGKYPSRLTGKDRDIVDQVIFRCAANFSKLLEEFKSPREYAKWMVKMVHSRSKLAAGHLNSSPKGEAIPNRLSTPAELNKKLAKNMQLGFLIQSDNADQVNRYISPSVMTKVLKKLRKDGIYLNIRGKKEIRRQLGKPKPGRHKDKDDSREKSEGRPSAHKITEDFERLIEVMAKPEAREIVRKTLLDSKLAYNFYKFGLTAFYYAITKDSMVAYNVFRMVDKHPSIEEQLQIEGVIEHLRTLNYKQLENYAADSAEQLLQSVKYDAYFILGIFRV